MTKPINVIVCELLMPVSPITAISTRRNSSMKRTKEYCAM